MRKIPKVNPFRFQHVNGKPKSRAEEIFSWVLICGVIVMGWVVLYLEIFG